MLKLSRLRPDRPLAKHFFKPCVWLILGLLPTLFVPLMCAALFLQSRFCPKVWMTDRYGKYAHFHKDYSYAPVYAYCHSQRLLRRAQRIRKVYQPFPMASYKSKMLNPQLACRDALGLNTVYPRPVEHFVFCLYCSMERKESQ